MKFKSIYVLVFMFLATNQAFAWGKRGHFLSGNLAARLLAEKTEHKFIQEHAFDLGYYNNVPDVIWKNDDETYKKEWFQHFLDIEIFEREMTGSAWPTSRQEFFTQNPKVKSEAGRAPWRIHELSVELEAIAKKLKASGDGVGENDIPKNHHSLQRDWLVTAGTMGHYIADLSQPLHCTENYDGQLTGQKGIHHFFEEEVVDKTGADLEKAVFERAVKEWDTFHKKNKSKTVFELTLQLARNSLSFKDQLLKNDKKWDRKDPATIRNHRKMAEERLSVGVLYLAEIWNRSLGWKYHGKKFYNFEGAPAYIEPEKEPVLQIKEQAK